MKLNCLIDYKIINSEEKIEKNNIKAIHNNNELSYIDELDSIRLTINKDNIVMIKENISSTTTLNFINNKKTNSEYLIKALNAKLDLKVKTNKLEISDNRVYIEYEIWFEEEYSGKFTYDLYIKEM